MNKYKIDREQLLRAVADEAAAEPLTAEKRRAMEASLVHRHQLLCAAHQTRSAVKQFHALHGLTAMAAVLGRIDAIEYWAIELSLDVHDLVGVLLATIGFEFMSRVAERMHTTLSQLANDALADSQREMDVVKPLAGC